MRLTNVDLLIELLEKEKARDDCRGSWYSQVCGIIRLLEAAPTVEVSDKADRPFEYFEGVEDGKAECDNCIWNICNYNKIEWKVSEDCISREWLIKALGNLDWYDFDMFYKVVENAPSVIPEPKKGEWVGEADGYWNGELIYDVWYCPFCDYRIEEDEQELLPNYCPSCGAKMK